MTGSPLKIIGTIRFQLDQLNTKNAHHEFEHLCRHFARQAIASNILPATGPVSAGGDQGRDFESFTTFVKASSSDSSFFFGYGESKPLVFACSLEKPRRLKAKIRSDVQEICSANRPYIIYFFSNHDIPIAQRHELSSWCLDEFKTKLEIIDAQALAEQLSAADLFWIAEHYLHISSELYPTPLASGDTRYDQARHRWLSSDNAPSNHADFMEIKLGLRRATFRENLKTDLSRWMAVMEKFLAHPDEELQRKSSYEICVAQLRGFHDLDVRADLVRTYFDRWATAKEPNALRDATILLSYCSSATMHDEFHIGKELLHSWTVALVRHIEAELQNAAGPNAQAELLLIRAQAAHLLFLRGLEPHIELDESFKWWRRVADAAKKAPLFPLEDFADLLTVMVPLIGTDSRFADLSRRVDDVLAARSKGYLVAEKSRDRAQQFIKSNNILAAIQELHRAKVNWFTAETMTESMLTVLTISNAYLELGLCYAAKYYALGAVRAIYQSSDEELKRLLPDAFHQLASCEYAAGNWMSFAELFPLFLTTHYQHEHDPHDWASHEGVQIMVVHFLVARSIAKALGGDSTMKLVEGPLRAWKMPQDLLEEILNPPFSLSKYEGMTPTEITARCSEELWGLPFSDCQQPRIYRWRALGIVWEAECDRRIEVVPFVEQFVAVLQIAIAEFATTDLQLLPTTVQLKVRTQDVPSFSIAEAPNNDAIAFDIVVPNGKSTSNEDIQKTQAEVLTVATTILVACSSLPDPELQKRVRLAYKGQLSAKAFLVRPYSELFTELVSKASFDSSRDAVDIESIPPHVAREHAELGWRDGPGFGYSKAKARTFLGNRYRRSTAAVSRTIKALVPSERFQSWIKKLRSEGYLDWQILNLIANVVIDYRTRKMVKVFTPQAYERTMKELMGRGETETDLPFPEERLYVPEIEMSMKANLLSNAHTWGLVNRGSTPDFVAWKRMLTERYSQQEDDIEHPDPFAQDVTG